MSISGIIMNKRGITKIISSKIISPAPKLPNI